jgi:hypothetical protein
MRKSTYVQSGGEGPPGRASAAHPGTHSGFELKTDWRVEIVAYNPAASTVRIVLQQPVGGDDLLESIEPGLRLWSSFCHGLADRFNCFVRLIVR